MNPFSLTARLFVLFGLLLSACQQSAIPTMSVPATAISQNTIPLDINNISLIGKPYKETITSSQTTNNCDGLSGATTVEKSLEQAQTTTFEVTVGAGSLVKGAPIPSLLEAQINAQIDAALKRSIGSTYHDRVAVQLTTKSGTIQTHTFTWNLVKVNGGVEVVYPNGTAEIIFQKVVGLELENRDSTPLSCANGIKSPTPILDTGGPEFEPTQIPPPTNVPFTHVPPEPTNHPTSVPAPTFAANPPTPLPQKPVRILSETQIPKGQESTFLVTVNPGEIHAFTSGPACVKGTGFCYPGGAKGASRGTVIVLLPRQEAYIMTGLVPLYNWHGAYLAQPSQAAEIADTLTREMMLKSPANGNCNGGCNIIDQLIVGADGVISSVTIQ